MAARSNQVLIASSSVVLMKANHKARCGHTRQSLRLGEGTGALLAIPLLRAAAALLSDVASLDDVLEGRL